MPYIKKKDRAFIWNETSGHLAYHLTMELLDFLDEQRCKGNKKTNNFEEYALAIGVIELTKLELWKRLVVPYEEKKCKENGDVFNE